MNANASAPTSLLKKYYGDGSKAYNVVSQHSQLVAAKAVSIALMLKGASVEVDITFIEQAALLHDIGVSLTNAPGIGCSGEHPYIMHGILGREILEKEGLHRHALVCERHIGVGLTLDDILTQKLPLPLRDMSPQTIEERIVCFADLFYSKKGGDDGAEKSVEQVRQSLDQFGVHKTAIFDQWYLEFMGAIITLK